MHDWGKRGKRQAAALCREMDPLGQLARQLLGPHGAEPRDAVAAGPVNLLPPCVDDGGNGDVAGRTVIETRITKGCPSTRKAGRGRGK